MFISCVIVGYDMGKTLGITVSNEKTIERLRRLSGKLETNMPTLLAIMSIAYENMLERESEK